VDELIADLAGHGDEEPTVQATMAHLNLVIIDPFRDGNDGLPRPHHAPGRVVQRHDQGAEPAAPDRQVTSTGRRR